MNKKISHRWPDGEGYFVNESISFGQVRLSIIDLSPAGRQPFFYAEEIGSFYYDHENNCFVDINNVPIDVSSFKNYYSIVFNGEIYNYQPIKEDLIKKGYKFTTNTDTEVILVAYLAYGNKCHDLLNGMWAFCIYDHKNQTLIFSRDRFGIKPLYYHIDTNNNIIFSSEIKAILEYDGYEKKVNEEMVVRYLYLKNDTDIKKTFFEGIYKFPNAHSGIFDLATKKMEIKRYWDLEVKEDKNLPIQESIEETKKRFLESIRLHKISDVEVGSCVSGGVDSSSIVCSLNYLYQGECQLKTFSSIFKGDKADESEYIDLVRDVINSENFYTSPTAIDLENDLEDLVYYQEEPFIGTSMYIQYKVMELARKNGIKVTLDGQGGDEVFGGYNTFYPFHLLYLLKNLRLIDFCRYIAGMQKYYSKSLFKSIVFPLLFLGYLVLPEFIKKAYLRYNNQIVKKELVAKYDHISLHKKYKNSLKNFYYYHQMENIQHLLRYGDKNSMRWGVESRVPFLEKNLTEYVATIPFDNKIKHGLGKNILREAMTDIIPDAIKNRYDKKWFETPENKWLRAENMKKYILDVFSQKELFVEKYINKGVFQDILTNYLEWKNNQGTLVWYVLNLELWGRIYFLKK